MRAASLCPTGRPKKRQDDGTDDGTLSRPRICKPLYGPWKKAMRQATELTMLQVQAYYMLYGYITVYLVVDKPQL